MPAMRNQVKAKLIFTFCANNKLTYAYIYIYIYNYKDNYILPIPLIHQYTRIYIQASTGQSNSSGSTDRPVAPASASGTSAFLSAGLHIVF